MIFAFQWDINTLTLYFMTFVLLIGLKEHPYMTLDNSLQICEIMDEIRQQLGVVYKEDLQK